MNFDDILPFKAGDLEVQNIQFTPLGFMDYIKSVGGASSLKEQQRRRIRASFKFNGETPTDEILSALPIKEAKRLLAALNDDEANGPRGQLVDVSADGVDVPILFQLGTPLRMKRGASEIVIKELEIIAKTFGDIEDIISADSRMSQTVEMLKRITTPVGVPGLTIMPEALLAQLRTTDGLLLAVEVLPNFID